MFPAFAGLSDLSAGLPAIFSGGAPATLKNYRNPSTSSQGDACDGNHAGMRKSP